MERAGSPGVDQHCQRKDLQYMGFNAGTILQNASRSQEEEILYRVHIWTKRMVKALIEMSLNMWKNRCKCLHGHTTTEQTMIKRQKLMRKIKW